MPPFSLKMVIFLGSCLLAATGSFANDNTCSEYRKDMVVHSGSMGFDYAYLYYCTMAGWGLLCVLILLLWVMILISLLCDTADNYFSPTLAAICDRLDLSPEVAGVTFLAFGNGAPDVFSSIAATSTSRSADNILVGVGALLGGAIFIITVVTGSVVYSRPKNSSIKVPTIAFLRDAVFLIICLLLVGFCGIQNQISLLSSSSFLVLYAVYVYSVFWIDRLNRHRVEKGQTELTNVSDFIEAYWHHDHDVNETDRNSSDSAESYFSETQSLSSSSSHPVQYGTRIAPLLKSFSADIHHNYFENERKNDEIICRSFEVECMAALPGSALSHVINEPIEQISNMNEGLEELDRPLLGREKSPIGRMWSNLYWQQWRLHRHAARDINATFLEIKKGSFFRIFINIAKFPFTLARNLTVVPVESDSWNQLQAILCAFFVPQFLGWVSGGWGVKLGGVFPLWAFLMILGGALSLGVQCSTHRSRPPAQPVLSIVLVFAAFASCIAWIYLMASEVVAALETIGLVTGIPSSILGLTVLAWGNSSADLVTNVAVSKAGLPGMALAGCFGGPLFNLLVGLGAPLVPASIAAFPHSITFELDPATWLTIVFALIAICITVCSMLTHGGSIPRSVAPMLLSVYGVYIVVQIALQLLV